MASEDVDYYALLEIESTASSAEIRKAYRQKSLKVHPDRNPDDPQAAALFHELSIAVDVLSDPSKRSTFDALLTARNARKARFAALDNKRKAMAEELERSERESKRAREGEKSRWAEVERLKEEGRRLREMRARQTGEEGEKRAREAEEQRKRALEKARKPANGGEAAEVVELGPLDKTLKIKWLKSVHPSLVDDTAVTSFLERTLGPANSDIDSVVLSSKTLANPAKGKHGSGVVAFKTLSAAVRLVRGKEADPEGKWKGFEVDWAAGEPPAALGAQAGPSPPPPRRSASPRATAAASSFSFVPASSTDEDTILARLRQKEREKLMDEMRRQDEADEGLAQ